MEPVPPNELRRVLNRFPSLRIGVIGDFALDGYWLEAPDASVASLETGLPTRPFSEQRYAPGGAGNVARNLVALGCGRVHAFGVVGPDPWGAELRRLLTDPAFDLSGLLLQTDQWATTAYIKPHVAGIERHRLDFGDFNRLSPDSAEVLLARLQDSLPDLDAVVINAQARSGLYSEPLREPLANLIGAHPERLFILDSRDPDLLFPGCVLKLNAREAARCCGFPEHTEAAPASELAARLFMRQHKPVFITQGPDGIAGHDRSGPFVIDGIRGPGAIDPTGAGDSVLAGLAAALTAGADAPTAAALGNLAAGVTIRTLRGTGTATPADLLHLAARTG